MLQFIIATLIGFNVAGFILMTIFIYYSANPYAILFYPVLDDIYVLNNNINIKLIKTLFTILFFPAIVIYFIFILSLVILTSLLIVIVYLIDTIINKRRK